MQTFTTINDVKNYVHEALATSEGYPEAYKIDEIAQEISDWDNDKQALVIAVDEGEFWNIVQKNTYYDLEALKWEDAPIEWDIAYGEVDYIDPDDEDRDADLILEFDPNSKEAVLTVKAELSRLEVHEWASSSDPQDWPVLDALFGRDNWQQWLSEQTRSMQLLDAESIDIHSNKDIVKVAKRLDLMARICREDGMGEEFVQVARDQDDLVISIGIEMDEDCNILGWTAAKHPAEEKCYDADHGSTDAQDIVYYLESFARG